MIVALKEEELAWRFTDGIWLKFENM